MSKKYITVVLVAAFGVALAAFIGVGNNSVPQPIACTEEAKLCPDGSAVGRTGPNCEFAPCPVVVGSPAPLNSEISLRIGEKKSVGNLSITVNSVVSDSRCPSGVQCIWAGELKVNVTLATMKQTETVDMVLGSSDQYLGYGVSFVSAEPSPKSTAKISENDYRLGFLVIVK